MFYRTSTNLLFIITCVRLIMKVDLVSVENIIENCKNKEQELVAEEDKYVDKKSKPNDAQLFGPSFVEQDIQAYEYQFTQRIFECIADTVHEFSDQNLQTNASYRSLVQECRAKQPTSPPCDSYYPYRNIDGTCNNFNYPRHGSTFSCFLRLFPANYEGVSGFRKTVKDKKPLPNARMISRLLISNFPKSTKKYNTLFAYFGQVVAHDIAQFPNSMVHGRSRLGCCDKLEDDDLHPQCAPIDISVLDIFYSLQNVHCFNFARIIPCSTCSVEKRVQLNYVTAWIDLSIVYGQTEERALKLRRNDGTGKLISQDRECGELPPPDKSRGSQCGNAATEKYCFQTGDTRANQHTVLTIFHIILFREHNRICDILKDLNPQWGEERLYQESRKILIAQCQVIIYKEYLQILLGQELMSQYELNMGAGSGYDPSIDPSISVEFNAASFRVHSLLPGKVVSGFDIQLLQHLFLNTLPIYYNRTSGYLHKMAKRPGNKHGRSFPTDLTIWMYRALLGTWGFDLVAVDIQRGRDTGLLSYVEMIETMKNRPGTINTFDDLNPYIISACKFPLKFIYDDVRDIDFITGIICEKIPKGMIISPTAAQIIAEQFRRLKYGDRFHVEHDVTLTDDQRKTLMDASFSKIICDNSKVGEFQPNAMLLPSEDNSVQPCSEIVGVDLKKWKE